MRSIKPYGAFVDIGGITGLLHISQISHDHITDVTKVLSEGQEISAMILTQDKEKGRFSLSTKVSPLPAAVLCMRTQRPARRRAAREGNVCVWRRILWHRSGCLFASKSVRKAARRGE